MNMFISDLKPETCERIRARLRTGLPVWRGTNNYANGSHKPSDPGDHGAGTYYTTSFFRARCHGKVARYVVRLQNPFIATDTHAYDSIADIFDTIHADDRELASRTATKAMQHAGFDGVVTVNERKPGGTELEIVVFPTE